VQKEWNKNEANTQKFNEKDEWKDFAHIEDPKERQKFLNLWFVNESFLSINHLKKSF
jgi:hypothetical protein